MIEKFGPREQAVRDSLDTRRAGIINSLGHGPRDCFAGLFNGALVHSAFVDAKDSLFIGKSECEHDWQQNWAVLEAAGLVEFTLTPNTSPSGHMSTIFTWRVTKKGWQVREDDIKWYHELMQAIRDDEAQEQVRQIATLDATADNAPLWAQQNGMGDP